MVRKGKRGTKLDTCRNEMLKLEIYEKLITIKSHLIRMFLDEIDTETN